MLNPIKSSAAFHIETSHFFYFVKQMICFYVERTIVLDKMALADTSNFG